MNQGTYYLYEYNNELPPHCAGFIRTAEHYQSCILQIHARNIPAADGEEFELSAFILKENGLCASRVGTLACRRKEINARLSVPERTFPGSCTLNELDGFLIRRPDSTASVPGGYSFWAACDPLPPAEVFLASPDEPELPPDEPAENDGPETEGPEISGPENDGPAAVPGNPEPDPNCTGDIESAEKKSEIQARRIKRSDLTLLPRRYWPLANNSFLLHGYHNYNHLLLLEDDGRLWLGVPGIYDPREARAADLFGFPRFTREGVSALDLCEDECSTDENFGHWCRCVR